MPKIVDVEQIKIEIMMAFQDCAKDKPLPLITLRDVAAQAGMSHTKVLRYFDNKDNLMIETSKWVCRIFCDMITEWFNTHDPKEYTSKEAYLDDLYNLMVDEKKSGVISKAMIMNCISGEYNENLRDEIVRANAEVKNAFWDGLKQHYGDDVVGEDVADAMMIIFGGTLLSIITGVLTEESKQSVVSKMKRIMDFEA